MSTRLTAEQQSIGDTARAFLRESCNLANLRRIIDNGANWDAGLWKRFAGELGFAGLAIPEQYGGSGLGPLELSLVAEELGAVLAPIPWFETAVLAAATLQHAGATRHLADIAHGRATATLALRDARATPLPDGIGPTIANGMLTGTAHFVPFGAIADLFVVAAREVGISLVAIPRGTRGVRVEKLVTMDLTRPLAHVHFDNIDISALRTGSAGSGDAALEKSLALAAATLAAEQVGGMQRTLDEVVAYSLQRVQFGRPIGSFQAMKHRMADMKVKLEAARSAASWAATLLVESSPDAFAACAAARAYCTDAYLDIASEGIQLHGGVGFTWDHHAHLFFKRARGSATLLDPPAVHREQVAHVLLGAA
ncbi:MAG: acyl-CoA dehydrogenase family protein [Rhodospirillales bacterium]